MSRETHAQAPSRQMASAAYRQALDDQLARLERLETQEWTRRWLEQFNGRHGIKVLGQ